MLPAIAEIEHVLEGIPDRERRCPECDRAVVDLLLAASELVHFSHPGHTAIGEAEFIEVRDVPACECSVVCAEGRT